MKNTIIDINGCNIIATNGYIPIATVTDEYIIFLVKLPYWKNPDGNLYEIHTRKLYYNPVKNDYYFRYVNGLRYYLNEFYKI